MKFLLSIVSVVVCSFAIAGTQVYETKCNHVDCLKNGWITTDKTLNYEMDTQCKNQNCAQFGWSSVANDKSTYDVTCRTGGCFIDGWTSAQKIDGKILYDDVLCKNSDCLKYGWTVRTGYDLMGGNVTCNDQDCSRFGGKSFWRGRPSQTTCYSGDCYRNGWTLYIY